MPKRSKRSSASPRAQYRFKLGRSAFELGRETKLMGILNVTPDSFSDGGRYADPGRAEAHALKMEAEGAHCIDIGGESTRPGATPVPALEEIRRIRPVIKRLAKKLKVPISVDTMKSETAEAALDCGARIVNDVSGLEYDPKIARVASRYRAGLVLMHMQGTPQTMQRAPRYRDAVADIAARLKRSVRAALDAGVDQRSILIDPGFGFGKTPEHNLQLLAGMSAFAGLGYPVLVGLSRKSFIGHVLEAGVEGRLVGSLAAAAAAVRGGAHWLRVHDVLPHAQLVRILDRVEAARC